jgi:two-component system sensor histidine kinase VicK
LASAEKPRVKTVKSVPSDDTVWFISEARQTLDAYGEEDSLSLLMDVPQHKSALIYAKERGVRLRYITNINQNNLRLCKELMGFAELRHLQGITGSGAISENECVITVKPKTKDTSIQKRNGPFHRHHLIQSGQMEMVEHQQYLFDMLWASAIPAKHRIDALETGVDSNFTEIVHNRERAENLLMSEIKGAKSEILMALNSTRYLGQLASLGLVDRIEQAKSAGASILVLCPNLLPSTETASNAKESASNDYEDDVRLLSDIQRYAEIRSLAGGLIGTIVIIDNKKVIAMSEEGIEAVALYSSDRSIVNNFASLFSALWTEKELFRSLMKTKNDLASSNESLLEANEQLKNHEAMQKEFINIAAHELRTPVQPILGMAEIIRSRLEEEGSNETTISNEDLDLIVRNAHRLERLSSDLLEVSRIESNSFELNKKSTIDLEDKVGQIVDDMQLSISSRPNLKISTSKNDGASEPIQVDVDASRFSEVLFNLVGNAIKFTEAGEITITTEKQDHMALVRVSDTGSGIDSDVMPRLFTKFAPKSQSGTGLGLFISKNIIEAHGGKIWAENNKNAKGATFTFTIPLTLQVNQEKT